ncbi:MAG: ImmA/IrrE family metallo-endopeptidase [Verrucomicrobia bacterium]|nr:ImmA/IrrE family metallo-endopeptidase [Verrucomicrobiota bacterium]
MSKIRQGFCKAEAHQLLKSAWVESPDEIDLESIAFKAGELLIEDGGLDNSEGRLVTTDEGGGTIRVKHGLHPGRRRFTIAHEIGHYILHPKKRLNHSDSVTNFRIWNEPSEEAEANLFAAELLMPEFLFKKLMTKNAPSLKFIDEIASVFNTSTMATAFQYTVYSKEPVALVVSVDGKVRWRVQSATFSPTIKLGQLHPYTGAAEIFAGKAGDTNGLVGTPASAWLPFEDTESDLKEDSRLLTSYGCVISMLWLDDDL